MSFLTQISPVALVLLSVCIALLIAKGKTADQLDEWGNLFVGIGSLLFLFASQKAFLGSHESSSR